MKKITILVLLFTSSVSFAQIASTCFGEPLVFGGNYTDTGDATVAHNLTNNTDQPVVNFIASTAEIGFNARYEPYNTPGVGLTDGDSVGVTDIPPGADFPFLCGGQGYKISDVDGNFILEFDVINLNIPKASDLSMRYFISETGYEGDGSVNETGSDRLRIYVKDVTNNTEIDILNTTGSDINDLGIEGVWISDGASLLPNTMVQLVIEARTNAGVESFYFDGIEINGLLATNEITTNTFSMFPNPATHGVLNITSQNTVNIHVVIFDVLGKDILNSELTNQTLNISTLNAGVYFVKMTQDTITITKKLIVR